jgi:hypothetical protein
MDADEVKQAKTTAEPMPERSRVAAASDDVNQSTLARAQAGIPSGDITQSILAKAQAGIASGDVVQSALANLASIDPVRFAFRVSRAEQPSSYSKHMDSPASYFAHTEGRIESLSQLHT